MNVYSLSDSHLRGSYRFLASVAYKKLSADGKRLFVLTRDQTAYVLDLGFGQGQPSAAVKAVSH